MQKIVFRLSWAQIWLSLLLVGAFYLAGQYLGASGNERSIQRQYDLMQIEQEKVNAILRGHLDRAPKDAEKQ